MDVGVVPDDGLGAGGVMVVTGMVGVVWVMVVRVMEWVWVEKQVEGIGVHDKQFPYPKKAFP